MDLNFFRDKAINRIDWLVGNTGINVAPWELRNNVRYNANANPEEDLTPGATVCAQIKFLVKDGYKYFLDASGVEFKWMTGAKTAEKFSTDLVKVFRPSVMCSNAYSDESLAYAFIYSKGVLFSANAQTLTLIADADIQPELEVKAMYCFGVTSLWCLHDEAPWATVYNIENSNILKKTETPVLSEWNIEQIKYMCKNSLSFYSANFKGQPKVIKYSLIFNENRLTDGKYEIIDFFQMGFFTADSSSKKNTGSDLEISAYDRMKKWDVVVDDAINATTFPINVGNFYREIRDFVGATWDGNLIRNTGLIIWERFKPSNTTGKQVLSWICQIAGAFAVIDEKGNTALKDYRKIDYSLTGIVPDEKSNIYSLASEQFVSKIDKVRIQTDQSDYGVIVGEGQDVYSISNNPLIVTTSDSELRPFAENLYAYLSGIVYNPCEAVIFPNPLLRLGDIISIISDGKEIEVPIMNISLDGRMSIESKGQLKRSVQTSDTNQTIERVKGKTLEIIKTVDGVSVAINNTKVSIQEDTGITCRNGGFRIIVDKPNGGEETVFEVDLNGNVSVTGDIKSVDSERGYTTWIHSGEITFHPSNDLYDTVGGISVATSGGEKALFINGWNNKANLSGFESVSAQEYFIEDGSGSAKKLELIPLTISGKVYKVLALP